MKKTWTNVEIVELTITATANQPTTELKADDIIPGVGFKQGVSDGSGPSYTVTYYPEGGGQTSIEYQPGDN